MRARAPLRWAAAWLLLTAPAAAGRIDVRVDPVRLSWSDFRRVDAIPRSSEEARIAAEMSFPQPLRIERGDAEYRLPSFTITVAPEPSRSVATRSAAASASLLRHEQGHYDIVVLAARALARELEPITATSPQALTRRVEDCVAKHTARAQRLSEAYDEATRHSHDAAEQARWLDRIQAALRDAHVGEVEGLPL
jgi:Bacterial protein of unknown function (DUF922)